jgi:peptidyl-prolyl cis-trans isomerase C
MMRGIARRLLREPLVHFLVLGALLFAAISLASNKRPVVRIDARELEQLASYWAMQTGRAPTRQELAAIIHERVDEELLAREALRLGLDEGDMIVRRRLAQKMAFASEDLAQIKEPDDRVLEAFYAKTRDRYAVPARLALRHVFFSRDRTGTNPETAAAQALAGLKAAKPVTGDPSLLPQTYADAAMPDLARDYGAAFAEAARTAPPGVWVGPVDSPYGVHLLRVERRLAAVVPPLAEVRAEVSAAWLDDQRKAANRAYLDALRRRYKVEVAGLPP